jgi:hypothetical protein
LLTVDYLEQRGRRADAGILDRLLRRVPDVPPTPGDELPAGDPLNTPRRPTTRAKAGRKRVAKSRVQRG